MSDETLRVGRVEPPAPGAVALWRNRGAAITPVVRRWSEWVLRPLAPGEEARAVSVAGAVGIVVGFTAVFWLSDHVTYDTWGPMIVALILGRVRWSV